MSKKLKEFESTETLSKRVLKAVNVEVTSKTLEPTINVLKVHTTNKLKAKQSAID